MTVTTTVLPASWPRSARSRANRASSSSPLATAPVVVDGHQPVGVAVESQAQVGPVLDHRLGQRPGWVDPQPSLMLVPSGSQPMATTSAPSRSKTLAASGRRRAVGAVHHQPQAVEAPTVEQRGQVARRSRRRRRGSAASAAHPVPLEALGSLAAGSRIRSSSSSMAASSSTAELGAPGGEELDAVVAEGVVGGGDDGGGHVPGRPTARPAPGWGARPRRPRRRPRWPGRPRGRPGAWGPTGGCPGRPGRSAAASIRAAARPEGEDQLGGQIGVGDAPDAVGAEPGSATGYRLEYWGALRAFFRPYFLRLLLPGVTGEESGLLERGPQLGVELEQRPGDAQAERPGLARHPAAVDGGVDVVGLGGLGQPQRLGDDHPVGGRGEVVLEGLAVDRDGPLAGAEADAGHGLLAASGGLGEGRRGTWCSSRVLLVVRATRRSGPSGARAPGSRAAGVLGGVGVLGAGVDLELGQLLAPQGVLGQHAPHGAGGRPRRGRSPSGRRSWLAVRPPG